MRAMDHRLIAAIAQPYCPNGLPTGSVDSKVCLLTCFKEDHDDR